MPDPRADDELDDYLSGDSPLSRQYRRENSPLPPQALERTLLEASDSDVPKPGPQFKSQSLAPLAFAASVFLSLAMVLAVVLGPQTQKSDQKPRVMQVRLLKSEPPRTAVTSPRERNPAAWLAYIDSLHHSGRDNEAELEMRRFRSAYPDYIIPSNE
jgi:hypothetical protein